MDAVRLYLVADPVVSGWVGTRIYQADNFPQGFTAPAVKFFRVSGLRHGNLRTPASLARPRWQFVVATLQRSGATAEQEARRIGAALRRRLEALRNTELVIDDTVSPEARSTVSAEYFDERGPTLESDVTGGYYRYELDFFIWYGTNGGAY